MKANPIQATAMPVSPIDGDAGRSRRAGATHLLHMLREAVRVPRGRPGEWAGGIAALVHEALIDHGALEANGAGVVVIEVVEPGNGRCLEIGSSRPLETVGLDDLNPSDRFGGRAAAGGRTLMEIASGGASVVLRAIVRGGGSLLNLSGEGEFDVRAALTVAAETYAEHIVKPERRRRLMMDRLTESQQRILTYLVDDLSEREIGERVGRSPHTVHDHVKAIYACLGVSSRTELLSLWYGGESRSGRAAV